MYVFSLSIKITQGKKLALAPLYLTSMYACLDESVHNINKSVSMYSMVTHADSDLLQVFV